MNIGIVTTWYERGAAYVSKQYKESLERNGHTVYIYARGEDSNKIKGSIWDSEEVTIDKESNLPISTFLSLKYFKKWIFNNKLDVVLFNEQRWMEPVLLCKKLNVKTGLYVDYYTEEHIEVYKVFDFLICNTNRHYSAFFNNHKQVYYIPWGTNIDLYDAKLKRKKSEKIRFFISAGMNPYRKGVDQAISGFIKLLEINVDYVSDIELIIHTQVDLKEFFNNEIICNNIDKLEKYGVLKIINKTVSAPGLYYEGDVYVYLSRLDGIGLTIAESIAAGMPILVPDDAPMNEFAIDKKINTVKIEKLYCRKDGYYWPQNEININDFANKLIYFIENKSKKDELSLEARCYAEKNLNWKDRDSQINEIFLHTQYLELDNEILIKCKEYSNRYSINLKKIELLKALFFLKNLFKVFK